jgi:surface protein
MSQMFRHAKAFNQDLSSWSVQNVQNTHGGMFDGASSFNQNLSLWNISNVTKMPYVFPMANTFNQDLSSWDVSIVRESILLECLQHWLHVEDVWGGCKF